MKAVAVFRIERQASESGRYRSSTALMFENQRGEPVIAAGFYSGASIRTLHARGNRLHHLARPGFGWISLYIDEAGPYTRPSVSNRSSRVSFDHFVIGSRVKSHLTTHVVRSDTRPSTAGFKTTHSPGSRAFLCDASRVAKASLKHSTVSMGSQGKVPR